jgi:hypothetical protein
MKLILESTDQILEYEGMPVRVWHGQTAAGARVIALIARVGFDADAVTLEAEAALLRLPELPVPSPPPSPGKKGH